MSIETPKRLFWEIRARAVNANAGRFDSIQRLTRDRVIKNSFVIAVKQSVLTVGCITTKVILADCVTLDR